MADASINRLHQIQRLLDLRRRAVFLGFRRDYQRFTRQLSALGYTS